jgi:hypothetical protein
MVIPRGFYFGALARGLRYLGGAFVWIACSATLYAGELKVTNVANGTILMASRIDLEGTACSDQATVEAEINGTLHTTPASEGRWILPSLRLDVGPNLIVLRCEGRTASLIVIRGSDNLLARPAQEVMFLWRPGVDGELKEIARDTLDRNLTDAELSHFAASVRSRLVEVFQAAYKDVADIQVTLQAGPGVHNIVVSRLSDDVFGQSPFDCGNLTPAQNTEVHIGTFRRSLRDDFDAWRPMARGDALDVRIEDVAQAVGRTAAHELGHSLGLVGEVGDRSCTWMDGCDGGHNCAAMRGRFPVSDRFLDGWHIMDPGLATLFNARLAEPESDRRSASRRPSFFEGFSRSYLKIIHPVQP